MNIYELKNLESNSTKIIKLKRGPVPRRRRDRLRRPEDGRRERFKNDKRKNYNINHNSARTPEARRKRQRLRNFEHVKRGSRRRNTQSSSESKRKRKQTKSRRKSYKKRKKNTTIQRSVARRMDQRKRQTVHL